VKIDEFNRCVSDYRRKGAVGVWAVFGCVLLAVPIGALLGSKIAALVPDTSNGFWAAIIPVVPMAALVILPMCFAIPILRHLERTAGYHCPHCSKQIASSAHVVIASKHCPHCGRRVIEEDGLTSS
jgi:hypothetical protein